MKQFMSVLLIALSVAGKAQTTTDDLRPQTITVRQMEVKPACYLRQYYSREVRDIVTPITLERIPNTLRLTGPGIVSMPVRSIPELVSLAPRAYQVRRGGDVIMTGGRGTDVLYVIDGMQILRN